MHLRDQAASATASAMLGALATAKYLVLTLGELWRSQAGHSP